MSEYDDDNVEYDDIDEQEEATETEPEADELPDDVDDTDEDGEEPDAESDEEDDPADDELGFSFDDDEEGEGGDPYAGQEAPQWVKDLRKKNRELERQKRELEAKVGINSQQPVLREKPTLEDFDYDSDAFEQELLAWHTEKQQYEQKVQQEQQKYQQYDERYKADVDAIRTKADDYDEVEGVVIDTLPEVKQAMLKMLCDNPAKMAYTLGKSPNKLAELSKLDEPQFIKQIVLLEQKMSQSKTKSKSRNPNKPKPTSHELTGGAGGGDTQLAKLEAQAEKTGDRSKVVAYKRSLRNKS
ncbi:hypothetical protein [Psychrobacter pygoscelis]|uniref:hypothetical protein n=1 Tax=Psychrobacter pygoscelis TaxID=2488563 RepID=UPI001039DC2B|nr:hypothetical protein [Psychrobacter pygoscelis]